jgi:hypothetical protein
MTSPVLKELFDSRICILQEADGVGPEMASSRGTNWKPSEGENRGLEDLQVSPRDSAPQLPGAQMMASPPERKH